MYIIIVGAGEVGSYLAEILVEEHHDVAIIESDERLARQIESSLDALVVHGSGVSTAALEQAGIQRAEMFIAVTQVDEVNLISCMAARKHGKDPLTVARVRDVEYLSGDSAMTAEELGLSLVVGPEQAVADQVVELLGHDGAGEIRHMCDDKLVLLEMPMSSDSPFVHDPLSELAGLMPKGSLVVGVRGSDGFRIPRGNTKIKPGERAEILTKPENIEEFIILSGNPWHHVKHTLIVGCGTIGLHLALILEKQGKFPTIIEADRQRADQLSVKLTDSIVLHGDGTEPEVLREQLEESMDAVVVLIDDTEKAILIGLFAKHLGAKKVIVRADKLAYVPIAHKMGIDAVISPRRAVANSILQFVRRGSVAVTEMVGDHDGEIISFTVPDDPDHPELMEKPLREIKFPENALVGAVIRDGAVTIAHGGTRLAAGDELLVVCRPSAIPALDKLFR